MCIRDRYDLRIGPTAKHEAPLIVHQTNHVSPGLAAVDLILIVPLIRWEGGGVALGVLEQKFVSLH